MTPFVSYFWTYLPKQTTENCIHIDVLSSPQVNAFCPQKCSGLVGNWGYFSRGLLRSFWWPQLCYSGCKRRPEQLTVIACFMCPVWNPAWGLLCHPQELYEVTPVSSVVLISFHWIYRKWQFLSNLSTSRQCLNIGRINLNIYIYLIVRSVNKRRVFSIAPTLCRLCLEKIPLNPAFVGWQKSQLGYPLLCWLF